MAFFEDPRLRQRWNQITHDAETATENAAAGIWSFQHHYVNPCLGSLLASIEFCTTVCLGDPEERLRRRRERARESAEYSFDFYDDWYGEQGQNAGLLGGWGGEDWDRLLAGTGSQRRHNPGAGETSEQPQRKRGMSYGTRGGRSRRKPNAQNDPTIIPSTQPIGFLSRLPWKMGGTLRYKPSAAGLQDHPGMQSHEHAPLLGSGASSDDEGEGQRKGAGGNNRSPRKRSGTTGSGGTSNSWRSRGDLFPSDGEGEEDAVPLDDEVTYDMIRKDDRSSAKSRGSSRKGKGRDFDSRTMSRTSLGSATSRESLEQIRTLPDNFQQHNQYDQNNGQQQQEIPAVAGEEPVPSLEDLNAEEEQLKAEEEEKIAQQKEAAAQLAMRKGLAAESLGSDLKETNFTAQEEELEVKDKDEGDSCKVKSWRVEPDEEYCSDTPPRSQMVREDVADGGEDTRGEVSQRSGSTLRSSRRIEKVAKGFVPARLPYFD